MDQSALDEPEQLTTAEAIKNELRPIISRWSIGNPDRIIKVIPASSIASLQRIDAVSVMMSLGQLEGYTGAALLEDDPIRSSENPQPHPIAWSYELHPMPLRAAVEVLLLRPELTDNPVRRLAEEVAWQIYDYTLKFYVDDVFRFTVATCVQEWVEKMEPKERAKFRPTLKRRLNAMRVGKPTIEGGTLYSGYEIRRNG